MRLRRAWIVAVRHTAAGPRLLVACETAGEQMIRIRFDRPQPVRIALEFNEQHAARTQQYVLRGSENDGKSFQEIVRQQWNFSCPSVTRESEDHRVEPPSRFWI